MKHQPVLLHESINGLAIKADGLYVDGTFGRGGHARAILNCLSSQGKLIVVDKDPAAINHAKSYFGEDERVEIIHASFAALPEIAKKKEVYGHIDGILLDLGVSSPQLEDAERGFSFMLPGPLDMRMDLTAPFKAADYINQASEEEMAHVFRQYGEERFARRIAKAIILARRFSPITTTQELAEIVKKANPSWEKHKHPATRVFQAVRIEINNELADLTIFLQEAVEMLVSGGRLAIISFHSLEDKLVKQFMRLKEKGMPIPREIPLREDEKKVCFKQIGKAIKPKTEEITLNVRARSAVLRIGEKL